MPPEPQRSIEELLKSSAETRRAAFGKDAKMPNPMRVRLHEELRLQAGRDPVKQRPMPMMSWLPLTLAGACAAVLLTFSIFWWSRPPNKMSLAAPAIAREPSVLSNAKATHQFDSAANPAVTNESTLGDKLLSAPQSFGAAAAPAASRAISFQQQPQPNESKTFNVLSNFEVQQIGPSIHITDQDGSSYVGTIERRTLKDAHDFELQSQEPASAAGQLGKAETKDEAVDRFYFRAKGINITLQKPLVFEGNCIVTAPTSRHADTPDSKSAANPIARIIGTAKVAGAMPQSIDAVSTPAR